MTARDVIEQSSCFCFTGKRVVTYDGETAAHAPTPFPGLVGAVPAEPLKKVLAKFADDEVEVEARAAELVVAGKRRKSGVRMDPNVVLPYKALEKPGEWLPLDPEFPEAVRLVREAAGKDESEFVLTCIHFHPKFLEASDKFQVARFRVDSPFSGRFLLRAAAVKTLPDLAPDRFGDGNEWVHFKSPSGVVLCCRKYTEDFPDTAKHFKFSGEPLELPPGLVDAAELAEIFSAENRDNLITVTLGRNRVTVRGDGASGWAEEPKKVRYAGPARQFQIGPATLAEIARKHRECEVTDDRLKVSGGRWAYFAALGSVEANGTAEPKG